MKLWTGDEWRKLSDNEAKHRLDVGDIVLEDNDPQTKVNAPPKAGRKTVAVAPAAVPTAAKDPTDDELERLTAPSPNTGTGSPNGGDSLV